MRRFTALVLAGAMTLGAALPAAAKEGRVEIKGSFNKGKFAARFQDWDEAFWANESLARMIVKGVIMGNADGSIAAARPVSRLEAAIMLARLLDLQAPGIPQGEFKIKAPWGEIKIENEDDEFEIKIEAKGHGEFKFEDSNEVPSWGRGAILSALQGGFLLFDGGRMNPMAPLNRLEAAIMLVKAAGLDAEAEAKANAQLSFTDAARIPERLRGYIALAVEKGFVTGYDDATFKPNKLVTRAEWAALLDRLDRQGSDVTADGRQVKGTVSAVALGAAPAITMTTPVFPGGVTYPLADTAVLYRNGSAITLAEVAAGDSVIINLNADRKIVMVTVANVVSTLKGTVTAYVAPAAGAAGTIVIQGAATAPSSHVVTAQTAVQVGTRAGSLAEVRVGDQVTLTLEGAALKKIAVKSELVTVTGTVAAITLGAGGALPAVAVSANNAVSTYTLADHATITAAGGGALTLADLRPGDEVTLRVERNVAVSIVRSQAAADPAQPVTATGMVVAIASPGTAGSGYSVSLLSNSAVSSYTFAPNATLILNGGAALTAADLRVGDQVQYVHTGGVINLLIVTARAAQ